MTSLRMQNQLTVLLGLLLGLPLFPSFSHSFAQQSGYVADDPHDGRYHGRMEPVTAHTTWLERDGAPSNITAIAETADGFLWLGTPSGLFRFDGTQFASYPVTTLDAPLPSIFITALLSDREGGLWIGFHTGGISHLLASGKIVNYSPDANQGPNSTQKFAYAPDGTLLAMGDYHLYRLKESKWENFGKAHGLPDDPLFTIFIDHRGTLWASARGHLYSIKSGDKDFVPYPTPSFIIVDMVEMSDGAIWISDGWRTIRPLNASGAHEGWPVNGYVRMAVEGNGNLWLAQDYRGVTHVKWPARHSALIKEQALTSEQTNAIYIDHASNIWVGTSRGLDRFHSTQVKRLSNTRVEYYPALCGPPQGGIWIATLAKPIINANGDVLKLHGEKVGSAPIACRDDGSVWMVDPLTSKLTGWVGDKMTRIDIPSEIHLSSSGTAIGLDYDGALLIGFHTQGLWRFDGAWKQVSDSTLPKSEPLSLFRDLENRVWLGYENGVIALRDRSGSRLFTPTSANNLGNVMAFSQVAKQVFAAGTYGIACLEGDGFRKVLLARAGVLSGVSGMVQDNEGNLWLNSATGLYRVQRDQLRAHLLDGLEYDHFDDRHGVQGRPTQDNPLPSLAIDNRGSLWASTTGSALEIDKKKIIQHPRPPLLMIERVLLNGEVRADREHPLREVSFTSTQLKELEIDYAGIDLSAPDSIRYRVMMEGKDTAWQEIGERRQAFYDHLPPGKHRFRVAESNDVGQWFELDTPFFVQVRPAYYETTWFRMVMVLMCAALLYFAYFIRVRVVTNALRGKLQERANERLRIARELHDTLLQSLHGLMLRFHFATSELPENEPARESLQIALQRADGAFLEARQRIESLREEIPDALHLDQQLLQVAQDLSVQAHLEFAVRQEGEPRLLAKQVQTELCRIAREALVNTLKHAKATTASIEVLYSSSEVRMSCMDNGVGIPAEMIWNGRRPGHWGLVGIAERAAALGGKLQIQNARDGGTNIEVRVTARRAYRDQTGWMTSLFSTWRS